MVIKFGIYVPIMLNRRDKMIGYRNMLDNKLAILDNMFVNNGNVTAYYLLHPYNYHVFDLASAERHLNRLYTNINTLYGSLGEMQISLFKLRSIVSKEETVQQIVQTVRMYKKDYSGFPEQYRKYIKNIARDYTVLAIVIDVKDTVNVEDESAFGMLKRLFTNFVQENFSPVVATVDKSAVRAQNTRIRNSLQRYAVPASSKLVMNIYINSLFPSYNLVYNDYLVKHSAPILSGIQQEIIPHLGWFEMSNSGIVSFGAKPRTTYGSVLTILEFPESIYSENFNISLPGLHVNMHLLPKGKALLKFKRMRASAMLEEEEAAVADAQDSDVGEDVSLVQRALHSIRQGRIATEVDANILVVADTKEELERKKKHVISVLSDVNVVCSIASNQARTFIDSFVKNRPRNFYHIMDLQYALAFQLDDGIMLGDQDSGFAAPVIGVG